jgi:hypothetical protein|tara:strand:+ start:4120 stop:4284 length:165 start_codon:yes stop_codon:yes gene_type:complete
MKYEVILNLEIDPVANFLEVDDTESSRVVLELIEDILYDVDDLQIAKCEVTRYD